MTLREIDGANYSKSESIHLDMHRIICYHGSN